MPHRPAQIWTGTAWDDIGDSRLITHDHSGGADGANIPQSSVTDLTADLGSKLNIAGGKILQIVRATDSTNRTTTSTSFVDASISVTITPQKNDSAIILIWSAWLQVADGTRMGVQITDNSNNPVSGAESLFFGSASNTFRSGMVLFGRSTPATINAVTYKGRFSTTASTTTIGNATATGQLYAIEVSA
jgi:hypothetical protein